MGDILQALTNTRPAGILQAIADPFERPEEETFDPSQFRLEPDSSVQMVLSNPNLSPMVKALIRNREKQRIRQERLRFALAKERLDQEKERRKFFTLAFGVVPTFQLGSAAGLRGVTGFIVDLVADPLNLITLPGLTKLGRAVKFLEGLTVAEKVKTVEEAALAIIKLKSLENADDIALELAEAAAKRDFFTLRKHIKRLSKGVTKEDLVKVAEEVGDEGVTRLFARDGEALRGFRAALEVGERAEGQVLQKRFLERVLAGQSAFTRFEVPFFDIELGSLRFEGLLHKLGIRTTGPSSKGTALAIRRAAGTLAIRERALAVRHGVGPPVRPVDLIVDPLPKGLPSGELPLTAQKGVRQAAKTTLARRAAGSRAKVREKAGFAEPGFAQRIEESLLTDLPLPTIQALAETGDIGQAVTLGIKTVDEDLKSIRQITNTLRQTEEQLFKTLEDTAELGRKQSENLVEKIVDKIADDIRKGPDEDVVTAALRQVDDLSTQEFLEDLAKRGLGKRERAILGKNSDLVPTVRQLVQLRVAKEITSSLTVGLRRARVAAKALRKVSDIAESTIPKVDDFLKILGLGRDLKKAAQVKNLETRIRFRKVALDTTRRLSNLLSPFDITPETIEKVLVTALQKVEKAATAGRKLTFKDYNEIYDEVVTTIKSKAIKHMRTIGASSRRKIRQLESKTSGFAKGLQRELRRVVEQAYKHARESPISFNPIAMAREIAMDPSSKAFHLRARTIDLAEKTVRARKERKIRLLDLARDFEKRRLPIERELEGFLKILDLPNLAVEAQRMAAKTRNVVAFVSGPFLKGASRFERILGLKPGSIRDVLKKAKTVEEAEQGVRKVVQEEANTLRRLVAPPSGGLDDVARLGSDATGNLSGVLRPTAENPAIVAGLSEDIDDVIKALGGDIDSSVLTRADMTRDYRSLGTQVAGLVRSIQFMKKRVSVRLRAAFSKASLVKIARTLDDPETYPLESLTEAERFAYDEIRRLMDTVFERLRQQGLVSESQFVPDYITHLTDVVDKKRFMQFLREVMEGTNKTVSNRGGQFTMKRAFLTLKQLKKFISDNPGIITLKSENIADILEAYIGGVGKALVQNQSIRTAAKMRTPNGDPMLVALGPLSEGLDRMLRAGGVDPGEISIKTIVRKESGGFSTTKTVKNAVSSEDYGVVEHNSIFRGLGVHKELLPHFRAVFEPDVVMRARMGDPLHGFDRFILSMDYLNSLGKTALFRLSPFHFTALTLSGFALLPPKVAWELTKQNAKVSLTAFFRGDPNKAIMMGLENLTASMGADGRDLLHRFLRANGQLSTPFTLAGHDDSFDVFQNVLRWAAKRSPDPIQSLLSGTAHVNDLLDATLWDVYQNGFKFQAWAHLRMKAIKNDRRLLRDPARLFEVERELAGTVGKAFGGIAWENFFMHKTMRKALQFLWIAPDWTMSNLLIARDVFLNLPFVKQSALGKTLTRDVIQNDVAFQAAAKYAFRSTFYAFFGGNMLNYAFTGKFLWDMDSEAFDHRTGVPRVELPYTDSRGRRQFMDVARMFAEPWKLVTDPAGFMRAKMGVLPRTFSTIIGVDAFGEPLHGAKDGWMERQLKTTLSLTQQFIPISVQELGRLLIGSPGEDGFVRTRDLRSSMIATFGFPVRSESRKSAERRQRIQFLERGIFPEEVREAERELVNAAPVR